MGDRIPGQPAEPGQGVVHLGLHQPVPDRDGELQRLFAALARLSRAPAEHQDLSLAG